MEKYIYVARLTISLAHFIPRRIQVLVRLCLYQQLYKLEYSSLRVKSYSKPTVYYYHIGFVWYTSSFKIFLVYCTLLWDYWFNYTCSDTSLKRDKDILSE